MVFNLRHWLFGGAKTVRRAARGDHMSEDTRRYGEEQLLTHELRKYGHTRGWTPTTKTGQLRALSGGRTITHDAGRVARASRHSLAGERIIDESMRSHPNEAAEAGRGLRGDKKRRAVQKRKTKAKRPGR